MRIPLPPIIIANRFPVRTTFAFKRGGAKTNGLIRLTSKGNKQSFLFLVYHLFPLVRVTCNFAMFYFLSFCPSEKIKISGVVVLPLPHFFDVNTRELAAATILATGMSKHGGRIFFATCCQTRQI